MPGVGVAYVVVAYDSQEVIQACLRSLLERSSADSHVIVVDNASRDETCARVEALPRDRLQLVRRDANAGFATAANEGALRAGDADLVFVNPDVEIVTCDEARLAEDLAGCELLALGLLDEGRDALEYGLRRHKPLWLHRWVLSFGLVRAAGRARVARGVNVVRKTGPSKRRWVAGALFACDRAAWDRLGGFDERFFLFREDADLSRRAALQGFRIGASDAITGRHEIGASSGLKDSARLSYLKTRAFLQYVEKWRGRGTAERNRRAILRDLRVVSGLSALASRLPGVSDRAAATRRKAREIGGRLTNEPPAKP